MIKIGLTGSISSGKTTASKIISSKRGPLFIADSIVKKIYKNKNFKKNISKKFNIKLKSNFKKSLKDKVLFNEKNLIKLGKLIHPLVRKEMFLFLKKNKKKKFTFLEIPLLIESKLTKYFDVIIFIKSNNNLRLKRYISRGGDRKLFSLLNRHQLKVSRKIKFCDHIVVNNKSLFDLKKKLLNVIYLYE